jgi:hypothetical protein
MANERLKVIIIGAGTGTMLNESFCLKRREMRERERPGRSLLATGASALLRYATAAAGSRSSYH